MHDAKKVYDAIRNLDASDIEPLDSDSLIVDKSIVDALCSLTVESEWALLEAAPDLLAACEAAVDKTCEGGFARGE